MGPLSEDEIAQMFREFGLSDEVARDRYQELARLAAEPAPVLNSARLDNSSAPEAEEKGHAQLA